LKIYFEAVESTLRAAEREYNWAVAEKKPSVPALKKTYQDALADYTASLEVKYAVAAAADAEKLLPQITLTAAE